MAGCGNDVTDLLPPYSSKTSRATVINCCHLGHEAIKYPKKVSLETFGVPVAVLQKLKSGCKTLAYVCTAGAEGTSDEG